MLLTSLSNLGTFVKLKLRIPSWEIEQQLSEFNSNWKKHSELYNIKILNLTDQVYNKMPQLAEITSAFSENINESYFLQINLGGFEQSKIASDSIDVFTFFGNNIPVQFCNIIDGQIVNFHTGQFYTVNPFYSKYMFSYIDNVFCLKFNVKLNDSTYTSILNNLDEY